MAAVFEACADPGTGETLVCERVVASSLPHPASVNDSRAKAKSDLWRAAGVIFMVTLSGRRCAARKVGPASKQKLKSCGKSQE
jgi:hypothetical protein